MNILKTFVVNNSSHKRLPNIKHANDMLWQSGNNDHFNTKYKNLASLLQSKISSKNKIQSQFNVLQNIRKYTTLNLQKQLNHTGLFQSNVVLPKQLKSDTLNELPLLTLKLPMFDKLKAPSYCEIITMKNFPDFDPIVHWNNFIYYIAEYCYKLIETHNKDKQEMSALITETFDQALASGNREAQIAIKQIGEGLFGTGSMKNDLNINKVSQFRLDAYEDAKQLLISQKQALEISYQKYTQRINNLKCDKYNGEKCDKYLLCWNESNNASTQTIPKQGQKDILLYYTFMTFMQILFPFAVKSIPLLSDLSDIPKPINNKKKIAPKIQNKSSIAIVIFVLMYIGKNSEVMGRRLRLIQNQPIVRPLLNVVALLSSSALDGLYLFGINKEDLNVDNDNNKLPSDTNDSDNHSESSSESEVESGRTYQCSYVNGFRWTNPNDRP